MNKTYQKLIEDKNNEIKDLLQNELNNNNKLEKIKENNKLLSQENNSLIFYINIISYNR